MSEEWRPVVGWEEFYEVSDRGRVRSLERVVLFGERERQVRSRVLKPGRTGPNGAFFVIMSGGGKRQTCRVHRMVLEAFVGPCPPGREGCHYDDDKTNNHLDNLRWDTRSGNMRDAVRNGTQCQVKKTHCPYGHEYSRENTKIDRNGGRYCRECHRTDGREKYWRDIEQQRKYKREQMRRSRANRKAQSAL